jgi:PAS domain S-box-containing protein
MKLTARMILVFGLFAAFIIALVSTFAFVYGRNAVQQAAMAEISSITADTEVDLNHWISMKKRNLGTLSNSEHLKSHLALFLNSDGDKHEALKEFLNAELAFANDVTSGNASTFLMDPHTGRISLSTDDADVGKLKENRPYFRHGKMGLYLQGPYRSLTGHSPTMVVSAPIRNGTGDLMAVVATRLDMADLSRIVVPPPSGGSSVDVYLIDRSNLFVTQPGTVQDPQLLSQSVRTPAATSCLEGRSGRMDGVDYRGVRVFSSFRWLPASGMCLLVEIDHDKALRPISELRVNVILSAIAVLLIGLGIAAWLGRTIARPISALQVEAARIAEGHLDARLPESRRDEIGLLARQFNTMAANLKLRETGRSEAEAALHKSEERFRIMFESAALGVLVIDTNGTITGMNPALGNMLGYSDQELQGKTFLDITHAEDVERESDLFQEQLTGVRGTYQVVKRFIRKDGGAQWVRITASIRRGVMEEPPFLLSMVEDITERRAAAQALADSEERFRTMAEFTHDWEYWADPHGNLLYVSPSCERISGYTVDEFLADNTLTTEIVHPDDRDRVHAHSMACLSDQYGAEHLDFRIVTRDGQTRWIGHVCQPVFDNENRWRGRRASNRDITERKQANEEILRQKERAEEFLSIAEALIISLDANGNVIRANRRTREVLGYDSDDLIGRNWTDTVVPPEAREYTNSVIQMMFGGKAAFAERSEHEILTRTGERRFIVWHNTPLSDDDGQVVGLLCAGQDITERRRAEKALINANRALGVVYRCRAAIAQAETEQQLLSEICRISVDVGGYRFAWIGSALDDEDKSVVPVAHFGHARDFLESANVSWADGENGRGFMGIAIRTGKAVTVQDIETDPRSKSFSAKAARMGFAAAIALPLFDGDAVFGALSIFSHHVDAFDAEERQLLEELANDLSYGIASLRVNLKRQQAEEALHESEARLRAIMDNSPANIFLKDTQGRYLLVNRVFQEWHCVSAEEAVGRTSADFMSRDVADVFAEKDRRILETGEAVSEEVEVVHADGMTRSLLLAKFPIRDDRGCMVALGGIGVNISDRKRMEEALRESEGRLRAVMDNSPANIFLKDLDGRYLIANRVFGEWYGISPDQVSGRTAADILSPELTEIFNAQNRQVVETGERLSAELVIPVPGGGERTILIDKFPFHDDAGNLIAVGGISVDISDRKRVEEALRESEEKYRSIINTTSQGCWIIDRMLKTVEVNDALCAMLAYSRDEMLGVSPLDFVIEADWKSVKSRLAARRKTSPRSFDVTLIAKNGRHVQARVNATVLRDGTGRRIGSFAFLSDITEHRKIEQQLIQAQKMEAIGVLAGGIAHDFNNILSGILGHCFLALQEVPEGNGARFNLEHIDGAGKRAANLVQQLLAFSRRHQAVRRPVRINHVIDEVFHLIRASVPATIDVQCHMDDDAGTVMADATQLHQVVMNLCTNAVDALEGGTGTIQVELGNVDLVAGDPSVGPDLSPGRYVRLDVADDGCGMDQRTLKHIFDPFFTTKEVGKGTGLGLSATHGIVSDHEGAIRIDTKRGKGTVFRLFFPRVEEPESEHHQDPSLAETPRGTERILLVDDEKMIVQMTSSLLKRMGYQVEATTSSNTALSVFAKDPNKFDLVITDQIMPDLTGNDLAVKLMEISPDIPIILCTGYHEALSPETAQNLGIREVAFKPVDPAEFPHLVRRVLDWEIERKRT